MSRSDFRKLDRQFKARAPRSETENQRQLKAEADRILGESRKAERERKLHDDERT